MPIHEVKILYSMLSPSRRRELTLLLLLMLLTALIESFMIGATVPFVALLTEPDGGTLPEWAGNSLAEAGAPMVIVTLLLTASAIVLAGLRLALLRRQQQFAMALGLDLSRRVFSRLLHQPYASYLGQNSSDLLAGMEKSERLVQSLLLPALQGGVAFVMALFVFGALLVLHPLAAVLGAFIGWSGYAAVRLVTGRRLRENSKITAAAVAARNRTVREALGGIRDVLIEGSQSLHEARYAGFAIRSRRAHASNAFINQAPRYVIEAIGIGVIALLALFLSSGSEGFAAAAPVVGAFAFGAQRLLPLLQQAWLGYSQASSQRQWLRDVLDLLELPTAGDQEQAPALPFRRALSFVDVSFAYDPARPVLRRFSCEIPCGEQVGIIGLSGSGKSTFADLMMGLLEPQSGSIKVDGEPMAGAARRRWQANIAHVPQSIYLFDDTLLANVAMPGATGTVDELRLAEAARVAQLEPLLSATSVGWNTWVGEGGIRLSGGQRQRIGIARALYRNRPVLILDEATNALDEETETAILLGVASLRPRPTLIVIAHRASALAICNRLIRVHEAADQRTGPHDQQVL